MSAADRPRFVDALRGRCTLRFVAAASHVIGEVVGGSLPVSVVVLDARDAAGHLQDPLVREIGRHCAAAIVAYRESSAPATHEATLRAAGVHGFITRGTNDAGLSLRAVLTRAECECAAVRALQEMSPVLPSPVRPILEMCLRRPEEAQTVGAVARLLGVHRRTLVHRAGRSGGPSPEELLGWGRLLLTAALLDRPGWSTEAIVAFLRWSSPTSLRNMMKRYTGMTAVDLQRRGALREVVTLLSRRIHEGPGTPAPQGTVAGEAAAQDDR